MKIHIAELITVILFCLTSCEKDIQDFPGKIPGMGNTHGDLEIKEAFKLPRGIILSAAVSTSDPVFSSYGSGLLIRTKLTLINANDTVRTVFFPQGLILKNSVPENQNGILLQTTWVCIKANTFRNITLDFYSVNKYKTPAVNEQLSLLGVTGSPTINNLLGIINTRKINYEMIYGSFNGSNPGTTSGPSYTEITSRLQDIVWNLTEYGTEISKEDKEFIESIPLLPPSQLPVTGGKYPNYFPEFEVKGN